jgi:hypothetical protein
MVALGWFDLPTTDDSDWPLFTTAEPGGAPNTCGTLYDTEPIKDGIHQGDGEFMQHYGLQLQTRAPVYADGWSKISTIHQSLTDLGGANVVMGDTTYEIIAAVPTSGVLSLGQDEKRRALFTVNFVVALKEI